MKYAGFWVRFGAYWLDFIVLLPIGALSLWANNYHRLYAVYSFIPNTLFGLFYSIYLVRRFGGTPGKLLMGLRIRKVDGAPIGYQEAILRYLPEALLAAAMGVAILQSLLAMSDSEFLSLGFLDRSRRLIETAPAWYRPTNWIYQGWIWSEFIVMMTNKKRRALHDFIAGTVVVRRDSQLQTQPTPAG